VNAPFSEAQARRVLDELERDLSAAVESDIRRQSRVEVLGRNLHKPIGARQDAEQVYRDSQGRVRSASVQFPSLPAGDAAQTKVQKRRATHRQVARQLARYLENVQDVAEETVNFQTRGKLDRHRYAAAMKDAPDVYRRRVEVEGAGFALSMAVDVSGSMSKEMRSGALCDAAMVLSDACEDLQMPYEVRSFSSRTYQYKAMDDPTFSLDRAAMLLSGEGGGTNMAQTAGLAATSLLARPERNKLFVSLTDGDLGDHDSTMRQMEQARRDGVLTFGIFLSRGGYVNRERMDQIYGKANWTTINSIGEMPRAVGQRIALLMRRAR
jgi:nitric oxide reductase activation protein